MRDLELALKAAGDPTRTRVLKLLESGALCVCQVQAVLDLAPSTISKHLSVLKTAGLVDDHRNGKWIEYRLVRNAQNPYVKPILAMLRGPLDRDATIIADGKRLREVRRIPPSELCNLPASRVSGQLRRPSRGRTRSEAGRA